MTHVRHLAFVLTLSVVLAVAGAACGKKMPPQVAATPPPAPPPPAVTPPPPAPPAPPRAVPPPPPAALTEDQLFQRKSLADLNAEKPLEDVYFDLDKFDVRDDARGALQKNADWMKRWTTTQITLEGHCDSRGSAEYNLALGTKRANAVRDYLVNLGVPTGRITVVSKGKEQPLCSDETDSCWQQNRRGHFLVSAK